MNFKEALISYWQGEKVVARYKCEDPTNWQSFAHLFGGLRIMEIDIEMTKHYASEYEFRLKPRTITVNGREIVEGETVQPEHGKTYYMPITHTEEMYGWETWKSQDWHICVFQRGLVHLTKENAIAHAKAMLGIE